MGIDDLFKNYQKKIGTYDKRQWERTIERRILNGLTNVQTRSTKPNTELIDVDLVRGSSFTKAKPKHGLMTVAKLATLRYILVPLYAKWWLQETSTVGFVIVVILYTTQITNLILFYCFQSFNEREVNEGISYADLSIPFVMMWALSFIHSHIVSTNSGPEFPSSKLSRTKRYRKTRSSMRYFSSDPSTPDSTKNAKVRINWHTNVKKSVRIDQAKKKAATSQKEVNGETLDNLIKRHLNKTLSTEDVVDVQQQKELPSYQNMNNMMPQDDDYVCPLESTRGVDQKLLGTRYSSDSDSEAQDTSLHVKFSKQITQKKGKPPTINVTQITDSTCDTECDEEVLSSPETNGSCLSNRFMNSVSEWMGVTTNSEDYSCSSDLDNYSDTVGLSHDHMVAAAILTPAAAKVSCIIWEGREVKKAELSVLEISSSIIAKVEVMPGSNDYFYIGLAVSTVYAFFPMFCRICNNFSDSKDLEFQSFVPLLLSGKFDQLSNSMDTVMNACCGSRKWERIIMLNITMQRWVLTSVLFFLLCIAERTFKQRFLYAKLFSHLTSSQKARKSELPHFRLNKVRNIKTWLSVRSYLKKRGPQRSVDVIVSAAFLITLLLLSFLCVELIKNTISLNSQYHIEALVLSLGLGIVLLRFMTLGTKINEKYRNLSVLITEQINLHLQMEQKPHKKDELTVANNVLKLAIDLLKELDNPFKISGLSANPILYNITKVIILSALSGILSEMLGFKLKLHKIKIK